MGSAAHLLHDIRHSMWFARIGAVVAAVAVLATIFLGGDERQPNRVPVPEFVRQMMSVDFPADGRMHVQARGRFRIGPTTALCTFRPGYGLDTPQLIETLTRMGQQYRNGQAGVSQRCLQGQPVFVLARPENNRLNGPYKVIVAVWQGNAVWMGAIERLNGVRPEFESARPFRDGLPPLTPWARTNFDREVRDYRAGLSVERDISDLSRAVLARIAGDAE
jgi:hypothetical protein